MYKIYELGEFNEWTGNFSDYNGGSIPARWVITTVHPTYNEEYESVKWDNGGWIIVPKIVYTPEEPPATPSVVVYPTIGEWLNRSPMEKLMFIQNRTHRIKIVNGQLVANENYDQNVEFFFTLLQAGFSYANVDDQRIINVVNYIYSIGDLTNEERAALLQPGLLNGETGTVVK